MRKHFKTIAILFAVILGVSFLSSCETLNDPAFYEGFREGWNTTAPPQYRY